MGKASVEKRIAELEQELLALRKKVDALASCKPWWERHCRHISK